MENNENEEKLEITNEDLEMGQKVETQTNNEVQKDRKGLAIAAMVLGIVSLVLFCIWYISIPCAILAIIFGILSLKSTKRGMAIAGISTGATGFVLMVVLYLFLFFVIGVGTFSTIEDALEYYEDNKYDYEYRYDSYDSYNYDEEWF